jgi:hypothetical protein
MNGTVFSNVTPCNFLEVCRCFAGTYCPHFQGRKVIQACLPTSRKNIGNIIIPEDYTLHEQIRSWRMLAVKLFSSERRRGVILLETKHTRETGMTVKQIIKQLTKFNNLWYQIPYLNKQGFREKIGSSAWFIRSVLDWMIGFIDTLYTQFRATGSYSATADLHTLQFTVTHALGFSVFTSRILATGL